MSANTDSTKEPWIKAAPVKILALVLFVSFTGFTALRFWPDDEKVIRNRLNILCDILSSPPQMPILHLPGKVAGLKEMIAEDCVIMAGDPVPAVRGREEIGSAFAFGLRSSGERKIRFSDVQISLDPGGFSATVNLMATASHTSSPLSRQKERRLIFRLEKINSEWIIKEVSQSRESSSP